jgi:cell wall-associated NlpC family hydrolase
MWILNTLPIISLRKEASDKSELVTQILYGEMYKVLDRHAEWLLVHCAFDNYQGWLNISQHSALVANEQQSKTDWIVSCPILEVDSENASRMLLPFGSELNPINHVITTVKLEYWQQSGKIVIPTSCSSELIMRYAAMMMGSPYLWGGRSPLGYDCSGFVQVVFKVAGLGLPRDARDQAGLGEIIDFVDHAQSGDLAFFENETGQLVHVGILDGEGSIIHCSGYVRKDSIDAYGIFNHQRNRHTHKLRIIKRLL